MTTQPHDDNTPREDMQKPSASVVFITPEMAKRWLSHNTVNRKVRERRVQMYSRDMTAGNWQLTGQAIQFSRNGDLIDGQHRLHAIIRSGCTVAMFVVRGLGTGDGSEVQNVIDLHGTRSAADSLTMAGHKNASLVASIARRRISFRSFNDVTHAEVHDYVLEHPEIAEAANISRRHSVRCDIAPSTVGVAAWMIAEVHGWDVADLFFYTASEKVGLVPGDPVQAMGKFFAELRRRQRKIGLTEQLSVIIRAFNYRYQGKQWRHIKLESVEGVRVPVPPVAR